MFGLKLNKYEQFSTNRDVGRSSETEIKWVKV